MIGTFVRSTHHLEKSGEYLQPLKIIAIRSNNVIFGEILIGKNRDGHKRYYFFQNVNNNVDLHRLNDFCDSDTAKVVAKMYAKHPRCTVFSTLDDLRSFGTQFIMLPTDFDEQYENFLKQNKKVVTPVNTKYCDPHNPICKVLFAICESANFYVWAMKSFFSSRISIMTIYRLMVWKDKYGQLVSKLSKGTITAYNNTGAVLLLMKECQNLRKVKRANDIINMFNTEQKKLLKANFDKLPTDVLNKFSILSSTKQQNFIRKVSTMTDLDEIMRLMAFTTSKHFSWSKESLLEYIQNVEGLNCKIILENETSVLVEVYDYETIKKLAKTTNWCISKNKSYWNNYAGRNQDSTQYVLFDFSKKEDDELSIVGFTTVSNKGITHAHSFTNADLMSRYNDGDDAPYEGILRAENVRSGIYAVISNNNIPLSLVTKFKSQFPIWTKDAFLDRFFSAIGEEKCTIYYEEDDKIVISTKDINGIINLLGKPYANKFCDSYRDCEHIFFADFSKNADDNNKLKFAIVETSSYNSSYYSADTIYNEYGIKDNTMFNNILEDYHLPYDIICRPNTIKNRFIESIMSHNISGIESSIDNDEIKCILNSKHNNELKNHFKRELMMSLMSYHSVQLLDIIEKFGYTIKDFFNYQEIGSIISSFYMEACGTGGERYFKSFNKKAIFDKLLNQDTRDWNQYQKNYVMKYYLVDRLLTPYRDDKKALNVILSKIINSLSDISYGGNLTDEIIHLTFDVMEVSSKMNIRQNLSYILPTIFNNNIKSCIDRLIDMDIDDEHSRNIILAYATSRYANVFKKQWGMKVEEEKKAPAEEIKISYSDILSSAIPYGSTFATYTTASTVNTLGGYNIQWNH